MKQNNKPVFSENINSVKFLTTVERICHINKIRSTITKRRNVVLNLFFWGMDFYTPAFCFSTSDLNGNYLTWTLKDSFGIWQTISIHLTNIKIDNE